MITITHAGRHRIDVMPGRALRLSDGNFPLFKPPAPESVGGPDECLMFLRELHTSLLDVFEIAMRRWLVAYFDAVIDRADAMRDDLPVPGGMEDVANGHHAWCYAAYRPLIRARFEHESQTVEARALFWLTDGPLVVQPDEDIDPRLLDYLTGVAAPHHPFVRRPLAGLLGQ
ncbi:MAG: hypothetical protein O3B37_00415 [Proteobacteria bacterium]|nr:hypothetical protein [Pseudomonadota bacterium]